MASVSDPYATLGVERDASTDEIRRAYRALVRAQHPDLHADGETEPDLQQIVLAYRLLRDPVRRADYDRTHTPASATRSSIGDLPTAIWVGPVHWQPPGDSGYR